MTVTGSIAHRAFLPENMADSNRSSNAFSHDTDCYCDEGWTTAMKSIRKLPASRNEIENFKQRHCSDSNSSVPGEWSSLPSLLQAAGTAGRTRCRWP